MRTSSLEELKARISAGEYEVDSHELAGEIVAKFALIRRVRRLMTSDEPNVGRVVSPTPLTKAPDRS